MPKTETMSRAPSEHTFESSAADTLAVDAAAYADKLRAARLSEWAIFERIVNDIDNGDISQQLGTRAAQLVGV